VRSHFTSVCVQGVAAVIAEDNMEVLLHSKSRRKYAAGYYGIGPGSVPAGDDLLMERRVGYVIAVLPKADSVRVETPQAWSLNLPCALKKTINVWGGPRHESLILRRRLTSGRCLLTW
jgi:hypothetical protein